MGPRYLFDVLETIGEYVDGVKYAGGSFALMPRKRVQELNHLAHQYEAYVSTGGWIEHVLAHGRSEDVARYIGEAQALGFDLIELSTGFIALPTDASTAELAVEGTRDVHWLIAQAQRCLEAGADGIMIESEGITESVDKWRTDVVARIIDELGLEAVMFEAADPAVFEWYVKNYGPEVNLFVDHSQIVQLECLRAGIWGTKSTWGRITTFKP
jgi:phosphosulfolactate synthase (CoM biosynthesis protein A)